MTAFAIIFTTLCSLAAAPLVANAATMHKGDPAGRGLASAFGALNAAVFALILAGLYAGCWGSDRLSLAALAAALPLAVAAGAGWLGVFTIRARSAIARWAFIGPAVASALAIGLPQWRFCRLVGGGLLPWEIAVACLVMFLSLSPWAIERMDAAVARRRSVMPSAVESEPMP